MAVGFIKPKDALIRARVDEAKVAYLNNRRLLDLLIEAQAAGGTALQVATGEANSVDAQTVFDNINAALGGLTTAYNAYSKMDGNAT